jgi:glucosamine--fructose-6-phosphate aminotransferase (isomerizing)
LAVRLGNAGGITIGYGEGEMYVASDLSALIEHTTNLAHLNGGEIAIIDKDTATFTDLSGKMIPKIPGKVDYDPVSITKGDYQHFMLKEINEQPEAVISSFRERISFNSGDVSLEGFPLSRYEIRALKRVVMVGMGTSLHAAMVGRHWIERIANIPAEWDNSSEFRYRNPIIDEETLFITISQSGETADTLAAMSEANRKGAKQITLCNYPGTQSSRLADGTLQIKAGLEIGVAGTKTFICSLTTLYTLAIHLGRERGVLNARNASGLIQELLLLPDLLGETLQRDPQIQELAQEFHQSSNFLFLGRGINYPIAMEGALKLKEISYIHAEGYPAGEMKHGPISLIDETIPIVALVPLDSLHEKMLSNISEAKARGGKVIAIASEGDDLISTKADHVVRIPNCTENLNPFLLTLPLQTLAYHTGVKRGCDVDQPRNLAKSVTVE